ncbi:MurR/RpiR family transcriptional regulator [Enterococcus sp. BWT-B8]|uniref:MurR/RpiR family transcriptional regulator n=1 Tax=Enterococcus sp. BWT-B8 TaxID=2885157 RepID=UPI001E59996D|nr:MurR/RpiR family transcriptional regulator [Enterococcus sp. BWT-B8]MCB5951845.1 MurR/RpiR family transcriptional regulator [Enterococcus sp. BWT-B8]
MDAVTLIKQKYKNFSKVNRRIADLILKNPSELLKMTASEIAMHSQTSPASVTRFARSIEYEGLDELKISIAASQGGENNKKNIDPIISKEDSVEQLCKKVTALVSTTLDELMYSLDKNEVEKAVKKIRKAREIYLVGIGASSLTTYDLYHKFNRAGKKAMFNFDPHMNLEFLNYSTEKDVLIAVSYSGLSKEVLLACEIAKTNQTPIIFITRNDGERIQKLSDILLLVPANEHLVRVGAISSISSSMAVGDILYLGFIQDHIDEDLAERMIGTNTLVSSLKEG